MSMKTAIDELTAQRNRIDRAIAALKAIGGDEDATEAVVRKRTHLGAAAKASLLARFHDGEGAAALAREFGVTRSAVYAQIAKAKAKTKATRDMQPDTNATAIGVQ